MQTGRPSSALNAAILLIVMLAASFSRAAWGQFAFAAALLMAVQLCD